MRRPSICRFDVHAAAALVHRSVSWMRHDGRTLPGVRRTVRGKVVRERAGTTSIVAARKVRARRLVDMGRGEPGKSAEKVLVRELLDASTVNAELDGYASVRTSKGHLERLRHAFGQWRAVDLTTTSSSGINYCGARQDFRMRP